MRLFTPKILVNKAEKGHVSMIVKSLVSKVLYFSKSVQILFLNGASVKLTKKMTYLLYVVLSIVTITVSSEESEDSFQRFNIDPYDFESFISTINSLKSKANVDSATDFIDITTDESLQDVSTANPYDVTTDLLIDSNDSTERKVQSITDTQLEMAMDAVAKMITIEIQSQKINSTWEYLKKLNFDNERLITKTVKYTLDVKHSSACNRLNNLLKFINSTSNVDLRFFAYNVVFQTISSDSTLSKQTTNWLSLQHFVSRDDSIDSNSEFQNLLNEIESETNDVLESPDFDHLSNYNDCDGIYSVIQTYYVEYLIKRFCSTDPANIKVLWKIIQIKSPTVATVLQFVKELERNNRLIYATMAIPYIKNNWGLISGEQETCQQLLEIFPQNSTLRHLFSPADNRFYIKNAYGGEYLCYEQSYESSSFYYSSYLSKSTLPTNVFPCSTKNSTWKFYGKNEFSICSGEYRSRSISLEKCERHNEWSVALSQTYVSSYYGFHNLEFGWELETDNVFSEQFRFKSVTSGGYLRVGPSDDLLISIPECSSADNKKGEWILERSWYADVDIQCKKPLLTNFNDYEGDGNVETSFI